MSPLFIMQNVLLKLNKIEKTPINNLKSGYWQVQFIRVGKSIWFLVKDTINSLCAGQFSCFYCNLLTDV